MPRPLHLFLFALAGCAATADSPSSIEEKADVRSELPGAVAPEPSETLEDPSRLGRMPRRFAGPDDEDAVGVPLFVSNNPEMVAGPGILASTVQPSTPVGPARYWRSSADIRGDDRLRREALPESSDASLERTPARLQRLYDAQRCANSDSLRDFSVYVYHQSASTRPLVFGAYLLPARESADSSPSSTVDYEWAHAAGPIGQWSLRTGYHVGEAMARGLGQFGAKEQVRVTPSEPLLLASAETGYGEAFELSARVKVRAGSCVHVRVVAWEPGTPATPYVDRYAAGETLAPNFAAARFGRAAGIYETNRVVLEASHKMSSPADGEDLVGWMINTWHDGPRAIARYADSADVLFGGFGATLDVRVNLENASDECLDVAPLLTIYPGGKPPEPAGLPTIMWNGWATSSSELRGREGVKRFDGGAFGVRLVDERIFQPLRVRRDTSNAYVPEGHSLSYRFELPVPSLIFAPEAVLFRVRPCGS